jgi:hypothetical protein
MNDGGEFGEVKGSTTKLNDWTFTGRENVTNGDGGHGKTCKVKKSDLLGWHFIMQQTYNNNDTSIWAQPNNCGSIHCWHNFVEKVVRSMQLQGGQPGVAHVHPVFQLRGGC